MYHIYKLLLQQFISVGTLNIQLSSGEFIKAAGQQSGLETTIGLKNRHSFKRFIHNPELAIGELYMTGDLWIIQGTLEDFIKLLHDNQQQWEQHLLGRYTRYIHKLLYVFKPVNTLGKSKRNVAHHYDLDDRLYDTFLDPWRQYSCAYFASPQMDLESAQELKLARLGAKLHLKPNLSVLDIGCGWGGLAYALRLFEPSMRVKGITLSEAQHGYANAQRPLWGDKDIHSPEFSIEDYRRLDTQFDRIVSVGMFEHVGLENYSVFFQKLASCLKPDGAAVIHTIARFGAPHPTNPWIEKYIFPGGYLPNIGQIHTAIHKAGLFITDIEIMRLHYADTLKIWRNRFLEQKDRFTEIYDEQFVRMWEFYLLGSEYYFRSGAGMVLQIQLAHQQDAVPLTRSYISKTTKEYVKRLCQVRNSGKQNHYPT